jgi:hypothetical protein
LRLQRSEFFLPFVCIHIFHSDFELSAAGNVGGILTSNDFSGMDETARQELVWDKLKSKLTEDERRHIVSLILFEIEDKKIVIYRIVHRKDAYK